MASNKELMRRFNDEAWNAHKPELAHTFCTADCTFEESAAPPAHGAAGVERLMRNYFQAFPDMHCEIKAIAEDGPWAAMWIYITGTHSGPFMGIPATNHRVAIDVVQMNRFEKGKIAQVKATWNVLEMAMQLGIEPSQLLGGEARPSV